MRSISFLKPDRWKALPGRYHSPHTTVKEYFNGARNEATPTPDCFYTDLVEWSDANGGKVRLLIEVSRGIVHGKPLWGVVVLAVTNYPGSKDTYYVAHIAPLSKPFHSEHDARWYCKDLLNADYDGVLNNIPDDIINK